MENKNKTSPKDEGATVVINHRVKEGERIAYEEWLNEIGPLCRNSKGHIDWQIIRPIKNLTNTYTVILRFDSKHNLELWMNSPQRKELIDKVRTLLTSDDDFFIRSGLDFWFTPESAKAKIPVRWKQFVITWSAIFPLSFLMPYTIGIAFNKLHVPEYLNTFLFSGTIVFLMIYVIMPRYTKLVHQWLFK
jgi:hypothetical protein